MAFRTSAGRNVRGSDLAALALIGIAWGIFVWWGDQWTRYEWTAPVRALANLQGPWLLIAFVAGARSRNAGVSALYGFLALLAAVLGYYLARAILGGDAVAAITARDIVAWLGVAVPAGIVGGLLGALWRGRNDWLAVLGVGLIAGVLFGEALRILARDGGVGFLTITVPAVEIAIAFILPPALLPRRPALQAVAVAALAGPLTLIAYERITEVFRDLLP